MFDIDWGKLLTFNYWFEGLSGQSAITPEIDSSSPYFWFFLWLFSLTTTIGVLGMLSTAFAHPENPLKSRISMWSINLFWMGVLGSFWFLSRQLSIGFIGARFWLLVLLVWLVIVLLFAIKYFLTYFKIEYRYFTQSTRVKF